MYEHIEQKGNPPQIEHSNVDLHANFELFHLIFGLTKLQEYWPKEIFTLTTLIIFLLRLIFLVSELLFESIQRHKDLNG